MILFCRGRDDWTAWHEVTPAWKGEAVQWEAHAVRDSIIMQFAVGPDGYEIPFNATQVRGIDLLHKRIVVRCFGVVGGYLQVWTRPDICVLPYFFKKHELRLPPK